MGIAMVNYGIVEVGIFFMLIGILAYFSLNLSMILYCSRRRPRAVNPLRWPNLEEACEKIKKEKNNSIDRYRRGRLLCPIESDHW